MKKKIVSAILGTLLGLGCFSGCTPAGKLGDSIKYAYGGIYKNGEVSDAANGFSSVSDVKSAKFFVDGEYVAAFTESNRRQDIKLEFYGKKNTRLVDVSGGMAYTLPFKDFEIDYTIAAYATKIYFGDSVLTVSSETSNPYGSWYTYANEWLIRFINDDEYISGNGLERLNGTKAYDFSGRNAYGDRTFKDGYDVYRYDIRVGGAGIEKPYYNIAIVREIKSLRKFALFVMKSESDKSEIMDGIVKSYLSIGEIGPKKNYFNAGKPKANPDWNAETAAYFDKLNASDEVAWGAFSRSMPGNESSLDPDDPYYQSMLNASLAFKVGIENIWGHAYDIYPTYTHLSQYGQPIHFPLEMAKVLAGGNGSDDKPVLQFTYQFTTDNNNVGGKSTPVFDILRGAYDEHFHRLARDIKAYGKPVLFRLNNEMNTDWTSYCGMLALLDPDIFNTTWKRLYGIFEEEGVDNAIWIWNPVAVSCPYSSWGEDLCYFPGVEYVQLLGCTSYEMNNYTNPAYGEIASFSTHYSALYEKNKPVFKDYGVIISEFACGSGNETDGALGRNAASQAKWVEEMFKALNQKNKPDWVKAIKGAVWFNVNDYEDGLISNRLCFYDPYSPDYDDLAATRAAFKKGFKGEDE